MDQLFHRNESVGTLFDDVGVDTDTEKIIIIRMNISGAAPVAAAQSTEKRKQKFRFDQNLNS